MLKQLPGLSQKDVPDGCPIDEEEVFRNAAYKAEGTRPISMAAKGKMKSVPKKHISPFLWHVLGIPL